MATIKPKQQIAKNLKQWIRKTPATKRIEPLEFHNACYNLKVDIELATEGLGEVQFFLRENGQSNKADAIEKLYNQLLSSVSTEYHKRSDGLAPMYLELDSAKRNAALLLAELEEIKPAEPEQGAKRIIAAILISFIMILLFELFVYLGPVTWFRNHPHSYGIQGSIDCLILCLIFGIFKPGWRKWCWGTAAIAFLVGLLSLL